MQATAETTGQITVPDPSYVLQARGLTKRFPGVLANDHIDLDLRPGEILAMLGENGAGKSTLMNVLYGLYTPDEGHIYVKGREVRFSGPSDAIAAGIGMVHQHFMLIPPLTVTENIMLGDESTRGLGVLNIDAAEKRIEQLSREYGLEVDARAKIEDLPVGVAGEQERVLDLDEQSNALGACEVARRDGEHVIDRDRVRLVDFGTGDDGYKRDWMDEARPRYRLQCWRKGDPRNWPAIVKARLLRPLVSGETHG